MKWVVLLAAVGHVAISSFAHILGRVIGAKQGVPPEITVTLRCLLAAAILIPTWWFSRRRKFSLTGREKLRLGGLMILAVPMNQFAYIAGMKSAPAVHGAVLFCLVPIILAVVDAIMGARAGRRAGLAAWFGIVTAIIGVLCVVGEQGLTLSAATVHGDLLLLVSVGAWCALTVVSRPLLTRMPAFALTRLTLVGGTLMLIPLTVQPMRAFDFPSLTPTSMGAIAYFAVFSSVLGYLIWYFLVRHIGPIRSAMLLNLQPVLTGVFAWAMLDEELKPQLVAGGLLVIVGVLTVQVTEMRRNARMGAATGIRRLVGAPDH